MDLYIVGECCIGQTIRVNVGGKELRIDLDTLTNGIEIQELCLL